MKHVALIGILLLIARVLLLAGPPEHGEQHGIHGDISRPRVGVMSEDVVRQKLTSYGFELTALERGEKRYTARVQTEGKSQTLDIDLLTGSISQNGTAIRLQPTRKAMPLAVKPDAKRVPWVKRGIRFEAIGVEGLRAPAQPVPTRVSPHY